MADHDYPPGDRRETDPYELDLPARDGDADATAGYPQPDQPPAADYPKAGSYADASAGPYSQSSPYPVAATSYGGPGYGQAPPTAPYGGWVPARKQNALAVTSLILAIGAWLALGCFLSLPAVICGHIARRQIRENPYQDGDGLAVAGLVVGWINLGLYIAIALFILFVIIVGAAAGS